MKKILLSLSVLCMAFVTRTNAQTVILSQNFDSTTGISIPATWSQNSTSAPGWQTTGSATSFYFATVPATSRYIMVNDFGDNMDNSMDMLNSPVFSLVGAVTPFLKFDKFFEQVYIAGPTPSLDTFESSYVNFSTDSGKTWTTIDTLRYNATGKWETNFVDLSSFIGSANCQIQFVYSDGGAKQPMIGVALDNVEVFDALASDIALTGVTPVTGSLNGDYQLVGGTTMIGGTIFNNSGSALSSFTAAYAADGGTPVVSTITASVPAFSSYNFTIPTAYTIPSLGSHSIMIWVTVAGDTIYSNDSAMTAVNGVSFMPTKKICFEEATGTWCGYCVRGSTYMDSTRWLHGGSVSQIAVHNSDPMVITDYDYLITHLPGFTGFPTVSVDRRELFDPSAMLQVYNFENAYFGFADISLGAVTVGTTVSVPVTVKPAIDLAGDYRLALVLTEDSVHGDKSTAWDQHNYYSSSTLDQDLIDGLINYRLLPNPIPGSEMYYQFVARSATGSPSGTAGSLPSSMTAGSSYSYTFSGVALDPTWNIGRMHAVVMLIRNSDGVILNSQPVASLWPLNVAKLPSVINHMAVYPNPAHASTNIELDLQHTDDVQVSVVDAAGRYIYTSPMQHMSAGDNKIVLPTSAFASGTYTIQVHTSAGVASQPLTIVR